MTTSKTFKKGMNFNGKEKECRIIVTALRITAKRSTVHVINQVKDVVPLAIVKIV